MPDAVQSVTDTASLPPQHLCASEALVERGEAVPFEVRHQREQLRAFALRFDGQVVAYLNRCRHVAAEMDWQPNRFLDDSGDYILCSLHGAAYSPATGLCVAGPCGRGGLTAIAVDEREGQVYWYPSRETQPVSFVSSA